MKILVCGGREFDDWELFSGEMDSIIWNFGNTEPIIIHGDAKGADFLARVYAIDKGYEEKRYPANWKEYKRAAGHIRNQQMLDEGKPDLVVAFKGGVGTKDMVARAKKAGVEVREIY